MLHANLAIPVEARESMCLALHCPHSLPRLFLSQLVNEVLPHWLDFSQNHHAARKLALGLGYVCRCPTCLENRGTSGVALIVVRTSPTLWYSYTTNCAGFSGLLFL